MDINTAWKSTCKVLLGEEIGELDAYEKYLKRYTKTTQKKKSCLSGKPVSVTSQHVNSDRIVSYDELGLYNQKFMGKHLDVNELKDIDSLIAALNERFYYSGNNIQGNSFNTENVDRCQNSSYVKESTEVYDSKFVAYSSTLRYAEYVFGSTLVGQKTRFCIKGHDVYEVSRGLELIRVFVSSDCFYCGNLEGCSNCMFSFNLRKKNYCIGNAQLSREKYEALKQKLVQEIRETILAKKDIPSIIDIIGGAHE